MKLMRTFSILGIALMAMNGCATTETKHITVPDLTGMPLDEAEEQLDELLDLDYPSQEVSEENRSEIRSEQWEVVDQEPAAGERVPAGTEITLNVEEADPTAQDTSDGD